MLEPVPLDPECELCRACSHAKAFHRPDGGACFGEANRNALSRSDIPLENIEVRKELGAECWCRTYENDLAAGIDSICENGDAAALVIATNAAVEREDSLNAERLLDRYVRKTVPAGRDPDWMKATARSIARLQSQATPTRIAGSPESQPVSGKDASSQGIAEGADEEEKRNNLQPKRFISKACAPITHVRGSRIIHAPKPTQFPVEWPLNYPKNLRPRTTVVICEALKKFSVQTRTLQLCKYITSELTPHFRASVQDGALEADAALSRMGELLHSLLVYNCEYESEGFRLEQEVLRSDEWLTLSREIVRTETVATAKQRSGGGRPNKRSRRMAKARESIERLWRHDPEGTHKDIVESADKSKVEVPWLDCDSWGTALANHEGAVKTFLSKARASAISLPK